MDRLEIKASLAVEDDGTIIATAWVWDEPDSVGDIIRKGAINVAVADLPMLFGHDPQDLIGTWVETSQTDKSFILKGKFHLENLRARSAFALVKGGGIRGISIGFRTKASTKQGRNRVITALDLFETSLVRNPAHPNARVTSFKQFDSAPYIAVAEAIQRATAALSKR